MENIKWGQDKNKKLKEERGLSFEEIAVCIANRQILAVIKNPSKKYKNQRVFIIELNNYIYYIPFVKCKGGIFLKTIIPSRKLTQKYLHESKKEGDDENA